MDSPSPSPTPNDVILYDIEQPHTNDVLCGRGVTTNKYPGNEKFRSLVGLNKELYVTSTKRQKMAISRSIVEAVRSMNPAGRFLEKNNDSGLWNDIGDRKAIEKTSQALRDGAASLRKQLSEDLGDPDFLAAVFDMDASKEKKEGPSKEPSKEAEKNKKTKPAKAKPLKKGHRRTMSNPDGIVKIEGQSLKRLKSMDVPVSPRSSDVKRALRKPISQPTSPIDPRVKRGAPFRDITHSPTNPMNSPRPDYHEPVMRSYSYSYEGQHHWHHHHQRHSMPPAGHNHSLSPTSSYPPPPTSPLPPGSHQLSPHGYQYSHRLPVSPVSRHWSPGGTYHFNPRSPVFAAWRDEHHASPYPSYSSSGELNVPVLHPRGPPGSPGSYHSPRPTSMDIALEFCPPPSPVRRNTHSHRDILPTVSVSSSKSAPSGPKRTILESRLIETSESRNSPVVVVSSSVVDESRSGSPAKSEVEVVLAHHTTPIEDHYDNHDDDEDEDDPAADGSFSPLPYESSEESEHDDHQLHHHPLMEISDDLLQLPIAPVGPDDAAHTAAC